MELVEQQIDRDVGDMGGLDIRRPVSYRHPRLATNSEARVSGGAGAVEK